MEFKSNENVWFSLQILSCSRFSTLSVKNFLHAMLKNNIKNVVGVESNCP